jgi:hypothetical protein
MRKVDLNPTQQLEGFEALKVMYVYQNCATSIVILDNAILLIKKGINNS